MSYNHTKIEKKWQKKWAKSPELFSARDFSKKKKKYVLDMFPYPSGEGFHVGHPLGYTASDIYTRFLRMNGWNVLRPMGWDAGGLPAENFAIKHKIHPAKVIKKNIANFRKQMDAIGLSYEWAREVNTMDPEYYKWTQWIFLKLFEKGLAYEAELPINFCPSCKTGLANEEVIDDACERCSTPVTQKKIRQWVLKITAYADRLIDDLDILDWPEKIIAMQRNWIGKSEGAEITFRIKNQESRIKVFTTRVDTLFGATYVVLAPEHPLLADNKLRITNYDEVKKYVETAKNKSDVERSAEVKEKTGVCLKGVQAINPVNGREVPVYTADYVLGGYGTGAVMAVPAHDERDFAFAQAHNLPIEEVILPTNANCIIVHGSLLPGEQNEPNYVPENKNHWLPWMRQQMEKRGIKTDTPLMPTSWAPRYDEWKKEFEKLSVHENTILVGHSAGCSFLARWLGEKKRKVKKVIFVAPSKILNGKETERLEDLYAFEIDKNIKALVGSVEIIVAQNDIERIKQSAELYAKAFGITITKLSQGGHFVLGTMGTEEFPELLQALTRIDKAFTDDGVLINSEKFSGMASAEARSGITKFAGGNIVTRYKLRDWNFSRQRYWGEPIPIIRCVQCGNVPLSEKDLPLKLPNVKNYEPSGTGESPLAKIEKWVNVKCPRCKGPAKRETNTMPQWAGSCWYYLRFLDPNNKKKLVDPKKEKYWMPVDVYVGGAEHAVLHLLYARFWHKFLYDIGVVSTKEPFQKLMNQGLMMGENGEKMSKSRGNVVTVKDVLAQHGADVLRMYEMFMGPFEDSKSWDTQSIAGVRRFLERAVKVIQKAGRSNKKQQQDPLLHKTIKKVTENIEGFRFNTAISAMMILLNDMEKRAPVSTDDCKIFVRLLAPFAPHITEEMWEMLGGKKSVHAEKWPEYDAKLVIEDEFELVIQVNGKLRDVVKTRKGIAEADAYALAQKSELVQKFIAGKEIRKTIFVKDRLINLII